MLTKHQMVWYKVAELLSYTIWVQTTLAVVVRMFERVGLLTNIGKIK